MQPVLFSSDLFLRAPVTDDESMFVDWALQGSRCTSLWHDPPAASTSFKAYVDLYEKHSDALVYLVCDKITNEIKGAIHLEKMFNGNFQNAFVGYQFDHDNEDPKVIRTALRLLMQHVFTKTKIHRLEIQVQQHYDALIDLLDDLNFRHEGYSPKFLKLAGRWRDFERYAITVEDWRVANL